MSNADEPTPEDIAGLFRKFGGDAHGYKEFAPPESEAEAPRAWPLLTGEKIAHPPVPAAAPVQAPVPPPPPPAPPVLASPPIQPPVYLAPVAPAMPFAAPIAAPAPRARIEPVLRAPVMPPAPAPAPAPAPSPAFAPPPVFGSAFAPAPLAARQPLSTPLAENAVPTPLEQLFARLVAPQPPAAPPGPMSRWRRPT